MCHLCQVVFMVGSTTLFMQMPHLITTESSSTAVISVLNDSVLSRCNFLQLTLNYYYCSNYYYYYYYQQWTGYSYRSELILTPPTPLLKSITSSNIIVNPNSLRPYHNILGPDRLQALTPHATTDSDMHHCIRPIHLDFTRGLHSPMSCHWSLLSCWSPLMWLNCCSLVSLSPRAGKTFLKSFFGYYKEEWQEIVTQEKHQWVDNVNWCQNSKNTISKTFQPAVFTWL